MSRSPYRKNNYNNQRKEISPYKPELSKLAEKSRLGHSYIAEQPTPERRNFQFQETITNQYTEKRTHNRLDTLIEQNKYLLAQNNELSNLVNDRSRLIIALERKLEEQIAQEVQTLEAIELEKNRFLADYSKRVEQNNLKNESLLNEVAQLNEDLYQLENAKNKEIERTKDKYTKEHKTQLEAILTNHAQTMDLLQLELMKLKENNQYKDQENQMQRQEHKNISDKLLGQIRSLEQDLEHCQHVKRLELSEQKISYENLIDKVKRELQKEQEIATFQYESELKRLKNEVHVRETEIEKLGDEISTGKIANEMRVSELKDKKIQLENEISQLEEFQKTLISEEKQRIKDLTTMQIQNIEDTNSQIIESLKRENERLTELNNTKGNEVMKLYVQLETVRNKNKEEVLAKNREIDELKELINSQKIHELEENELFKSKMAHLRHADISSLKNYYENQIVALLQDLENKEKIVEENREKLHHEIQDKTEMRKNFDIEVSKLYVRIGDLELKLAKLANEKKEELNNIGSQMELTSMTMVRLNQEKEKYAIFSHTEKERLQKMINDKDREIDELLEKNKIMQENHFQEIEEKNEEIERLKRIVEELEVNLRKEKLFFENQIKRKEIHHKNDKDFYESEISRIKRESNSQYSALLSKTSEEKNFLENQIAILKTSEKDLKNELAVLKEKMEQQLLNNQITISQQKERVTSMKDLMQVNLNSYYKREMDAKNQEITDLRQQLHEKNEDIRSHMEKEKKLEEKIDKLLQSQEKLREMEEKVINLGQENNLMKNISQLVKNRRK